MQYQLLYSRGLHIRPTMRVLSGTLLLITITCLLWHIIDGCEPSQMQNGCKIFGTVCNCGYGCKSEYMYRTRRACLNALRERSTNICFQQPCLRGICIQTAQEPGFACKCEGTGYYGQRCEKGCSESDKNYGCAIKGSLCTCQYGCKDEFIYKTRRSCITALRKNMVKSSPPTSTTDAPLPNEVNKSVDSDINVSSTTINDVVILKIDPPSTETTSSYDYNESEQMVPMQICLLQWGTIRKYP